MYISVTFFIVFLQYVCICAMAVYGFNLIGPQAIEENILIPAKMKGLIFNTFFSEELTCTNRGIFLYRCISGLVDLKFELLIFEVITIVSWSQSYTKVDFSAFLCVANMFEVMF